MRYICQICGYIYDDDKEKVPFDELPSDWKCPLCGATKSDFKKEEEKKVEVHEKEDLSELVKLNVSEMGAVLSSLARGCEKQGLKEEQEKFMELASYFDSIRPKVENKKVEDLLALINEDTTYYESLEEYCLENSDRGAARVSVWGKKVNMMLSSLLERYILKGEDLLKDQDIWVCSVCGFVYIGNTPPELCPVCKVPSWKFEKVEGLA